MASIYKRKGLWRTEVCWRGIRRRCWRYKCWGEESPPPKSGIDLIEHHLKDAEFDYAERFGKEQKP